MADTSIPSVGETNTVFKVAFDTVPKDNLLDFTVKEVMLTESLLTPGLQTSILVDSYLHASPISEGNLGKPKNWDDFKEQLLNIRIERPVLKDFGFDTTLDVSQRIYRIDSRKLINNNNEQFRIHACDDSLLNDARSLVSKSWKCTAPSAIAREVLQTCAGVRSIDVEDAYPARDYIAENIHPFQVVTQQANASLAGGNDPSFVHYMTYENFGTHKFRSIYSLTKEAPINPTSRPFLYSETGANSGYGNPWSILTYSFPCDFDLLSDLLNGIDTDGSFMTSLTTGNPYAGTWSLFGNQALGCGIGGGVYKQSKTNLGSEKAQDQCPYDVEKYLLKRQARMSLLEQDKIALRLTIPWNPVMNVGKMINVMFKRKNVKDPGAPDGVLYGTGQYLIVNLTHTIKSGGYGTTTMECVADTVGQGIV